MQSNSSADELSRSDNDTLTQPEDVVEVPSFTTKNGRRFRNFRNDVEMKLFQSVLSHNPFQKGLSRRWMDITFDVKEYIIQNGEGSTENGPYPSKDKCRKHVVEELMKFQRSDSQKRSATGTDNENVGERENLLYEIAQLYEEAEQTQLASSSSQVALRKRMMAEGKVIRDAASRTESLKRPRSNSGSSKRTANKFEIHPLIGKMIENLDERYKRDYQLSKEKFEFEKEEVTKKRKLYEDKLEHDKICFLKLTEIQKKLVENMEEIRQKLSKRTYEDCVERTENSEQEE